MMLQSRRVIILGRKAGAARALKFLLSKGVMVPFVVADPVEHGPETLRSCARSRSIRVFTDDAPIYRMIEHGDPLVANIDLVISYLYPKRIREPLIRLGRHGCVNYHPAPLPDYKASAGYNAAILHKQPSYGVSVHYIDSEKFDAGPIIKVLRFPIDQNRETAWSLERTTQKKLFELFSSTVGSLLKKARAKTKKNQGGVYWTRAELEREKRIDVKRHTPDEIDRRIRAFFFPPYTGANIDIGGKRFTLVNDELLQEIHRFMKKSSTEREV